MDRDVVINPVQVRSIALQLTGELTPASVLAVADVVDHAAPGLSALVLGLRALDLLSVSGLRPLTALSGKLALDGVRCCVVVQPGTATAAVFEGADAHDVLPSFPDVEQALSETTTDTEVVAQPFEMLTRALLGTRTVGGALQHVVDATAVAIPAAAVVSVTLRSSEGEVFTPVHTDGAAADLDRVQYATGRGPCLDSADPRGPAYAASHDLEAERRWPEFAAAAAAAGYRAVHSTEVLPGAGPGRSTGALNIYFIDPYTLDDTDRHTALLLATHAALALAHARSTELADLNDIRLHQAIDTRDVIGQAKGILMHRQGITADEAFALLRATSQNLNVKLVDIARNLVDRHSELDR
ncbi:ANTAR domain-containing protein [Amycolatopsis sp., V23-08]|uniref:ANTAR domain-containing protein n=1 Tax=Amycolatopsis heterodermiae TaxID=3110235 RepID=A0ABU5RLG3_9PSEU|nr:ANTAR domain-containing protein [Amycolatopsis sp., V23-08]MEA5367141.1 ANTAR domain-containing protein [Amycolatopsis sp., V23-08]